MTEVTSWDLIGGEWPELSEGSPEKRLAYAVLRSAVETLVLSKDGHTTHPDIEGLDIRADYFNARSWIFSDEYESDGVSIDWVCDAVDISKDDFRGMMKRAGF